MVRVEGSISLATHTPLCLPQPGMEVRGGNITLAGQQTLDTRQSPVLTCCVVRLGPGHLPPRRAQPRVRWGEDCQRATGTIQYSTVHTAFTVQCSTVQYMLQELTMPVPSHQTCSRTSFVQFLRGDTARKKCP